MPPLPLKSLERGRLYRVDDRNAGVALYEGDGRFVVARSKFGLTFLEFALHESADPRYGTVRVLEPLPLTYDPNRIDRSGMSLDDPRLLALLVSLETRPGVL